MPALWFRIGVPSISWAPSGSDQWGLLYPTTGGVRFEETWSKYHPTSVTVRFTVLGPPELFPQQGQKVDLRVVYPCWQDGNQEVRIACNAEVLSTVQTLGADQVETSQYEITFFKHDWELDLTANEYIQRNKEVTVNPDASPPFSLS